METEQRNETAPPLLYGKRREDYYASLVVLLLNQGRTTEAADLMERHEKRREWEAQHGYA